MELKNCFSEDQHYFSSKNTPIEKRFNKWLWKTSQNPKVEKAYSYYRNFYPLKWNTETEDHFNHMLIQVEKESLQEILNVLLIEPLADYFWYDHDDGKLSYSVSTRTRIQHKTIPGHSIRVDEEKIKIFLRDYKLNKLGV
jgi:hypothetical protein